jgi:hypothetical protein
MDPTNPNVSQFWGNYLSVEKEMKACFELNGGTPYVKSWKEHLAKKCEAVHGYWLDKKFPIGNLKFNNVPKLNTLYFIDLNNI